MICDLDNRISARQKHMFSQNLINRMLSVTYRDVELYVYLSDRCRYIH